MSEAEYVALIGVGGTLAAALLGAVGGYWLAVAKTNRDRVNRVAAAWGAISAEVESYASMASEFVQPVGGDRVMSPQWRLSTTVFQASLPALIADAAPSEREVQELLHFYREADSLNRGLDWLQEISIGGGAGAFRRDEVNDLRLAALCEAASITWRSARCSIRAPGRLRQSCRTASERRSGTSG